MGMYCYNVKPENYRIEKSFSYSISYSYSNLKVPYYKVRNWQRRHVQARQSNRGVFQISLK